MTDASTSEVNASAGGTPRPAWDLGTSYDLFVSLHVLHDPGRFGLRGAWAAGVRSRLPVDARRILEQSVDVCGDPYQWIYGLPAPKDSQTALHALGQLPAADRVQALAGKPGSKQAAVAQIQQKVRSKRAWAQDDRRELQQGLRSAGKSISTDGAEVLLTWWANPEEYGSRLLEALQTYYEVFFAEEEARIQPALKRSLQRAQELASRLEILDLLEELSGGLRFEDLMPEIDLVLIPSYWVTPLVLHTPLGGRQMLFLFGARPAEDSLVPGDPVPDALLQALKALSDPTRLRILRYLSARPLTATELSRRLRLRLPTVTHHLDVLRLAGLIGVTFRGGKQDRRYSARKEMIARIFARLDRFLLTRERSEPDPADANRIW